MFWEVIKVYKGEVMYEDLPQSQMISSLSEDIVLEFLTLTSGGSDSP